MENVLTAFIIIFLILFAVLTLTGVLAQAQTTLQESWETMQQRIDTQTHTSLSAQAAYTQAQGTQVLVIWRNVGSTRLYDFNRWDVIVQYYDNSTPAQQQIDWIVYSSAAPNNGEWGVDGIFMDAAAGHSEVFEPTVLNPTEELRMNVTISPPVGQGEAAQVILAAENGAANSIMLLGNWLPVLEVNAVLTLAQGAEATIGTARLSTSDQDDPAAELIYTVTTPPTEGTLTPATTFTQADIDAGALRYAHTGSSGTDQFSFTVSDGKDTIGAYTFDITISAPPTLVSNNELHINAAGAWTISSLHLLTEDPDDSDVDLRYTVTQSPAYGMLNMSSFTQDDIDQGLLVYNTPAPMDDSFQFTISDGESTIGSYTFVFNAP